MQGVGRVPPEDPTEGQTGEEPLGRLATADLRKLKQKVHGLLDPIWMGLGYGERSKTYKWLADGLGIPLEDCHVGMFDEEACKKAIEFLEEHAPKRSAGMPSVALG